MKIYICDNCGKKVNELYYLDLRCYELNSRLAHADICEKCIKAYIKGKITQLPMELIKKK